MNNSIVVIDSSDEEDTTPPIKKIKPDNLVKPIIIGEIKSLVEKDVVVIEDEEERVAAFDIEAIKSKINNDELTIIKKKNSVKDIPETDITHRRVELTPVTKTKTKANINFKENQLECLIEPSTSKSNPEIQENGVSSTSEDKKNDPTEEFDTFLNLCKNCECESKYKTLIEQKLPKLQEKFNQANEKYTKSTKLKTLLNENIAKLKRRPSDVILFFSEIYRELSAQKKRTIEITEKDKRNLEKLQKVLRKINKKIDELETAECDFDEESNSAYLMVDRYKKRATLIYKKICNITNDNPYGSRQMYKNLDISCSKYSEINRAVDRLYSKNKQFPSYYDVDRCVRKCVKQNKLVIAETVLTCEINKMFTHVGELLKRRRKLETYESINSLVEPNEQVEDPELEKLMDERHITNNKRIDEVLETFSTYQELGKDPSVSSDSDDSNHKSEDSSDE